MLGSNENGTRIFTWDTEEVRRNCGAHPKKEAAMLPVLYLAQEEFGHLGLRRLNMSPH